MFKYFTFVISLFISTCVLADKPLTIYTVNYPLAYFTERIADKYAEVVFPAPKDVDPAFWEPDINTIIQYQKADLIIINGANYAKWINKISLPRSRMVNTSSAFRGQYIHMTETTTHQHGPAGDHSHAGIAFTIWLDLQLAIEQAKAIKQAIIKKRSQYRKIIEQNYLELEQELLNIDQKLQDILLKYDGQPLLASHPVYQYLARRYDINLESVLWEPDVIPDENEWQNFELILKVHPARYMLWEAEPATETLDRLNQYGIKAIVFNPGANNYDDENFISIMMKNVANLNLLGQ